jgi:hypothetical protein
MFKPDARNVCLENVFDARLQSASDTLYVIIACAHAMKAEVCKLWEEF